MSRHANLALLAFVFTLSDGVTLFGQTALYWVDLGDAPTDNVSRANLDGSNPQLLRILPDDVDPPGIVFDSVHNVLYWTDNNGIHRATPDASSYSTIVGFPPDNTPFGIDLDVAHGKLYWCSMDGIHRANLDGTGIESIIPIPNFFFFSPPTISIDETGGHIYYTWERVDEQTHIPHLYIQRAKLDGSEIVTLAEEIGLNSFGIAVDRLGRKLYWLINNHSAVTGSIRRSDLDGSNATTLYDFGTTEYPQSLALQEQTGTLYWFDALGQRIRRGSVDGTAAEDVVTQGLGLVLGMSVRQSALCAPTTTFADITGPFSQANFGDVSSVVDCFRGAPGASPLAQCDLDPCEVSMDRCLGDGVVNFRDIVRAVDAFRGLGCI